MWSSICPMSRQGLPKTYFSCIWDITLATETYYFCTMLHKDGYCWASGVIPSHVSSQKWALSPLHCKRAPFKKKSSFNFINPFQKGESKVFAFTWDKDLEWRYLLVISSWQTLSSNKSLNSHFHNKTLIFLISRTSILSPPWYLGRHIIFHRVIVYIFSCVHHFAKKAWSKKIH
jgi:hypothetical protein